MQKKNRQANTYTIMCIQRPQRSLPIDSGVIQKKSRGGGFPENGELLLPLIPSLELLWPKNKVMDALQCASAVHPYVVES